MDPETEQRLRAYAEKHGITWKGGVKLDGEHWRARLKFSDENVIYHGTADTEDGAVARAVSFAISSREAPPRPPQGSINVRDGR